MVDDARHTIRVVELIVAYPLRFLQEGALCMPRGLK